jgi:hypothetical protein
VRHVEEFFGLEKKMGNEEAAEYIREYMHFYKTLLGASDIMNRIQSWQYAEFAPPHEEIDIMTDLLDESVRKVNDLRAYGWKKLPQEAVTAAIEKTLQELQEKREILEVLLKK